MPVARQEYAMTACVKICVCSILRLNKTSTANLTANPAMRAQILTVAPQEYAIKAFAVIIVCSIFLKPRAANTKAKSALRAMVKTTVADHRFAPAAFATQCSSFERAPS